MPSSSSRSSRTNKRKSKRHYSVDPALSKACAQWLGTRIKSVEYPGGRSRRSCRLLLANGQSVIVTQRKKAHRAKLERRVLGELSERGAPVPRVLGSNDVLLFQEDLGRTRLSETLHRAGEASDEDGACTLLSAGLKSLTEIHRAAEAAELETMVAVAGESEDWLKGLIDRPALIGKYLDVPAPRPQLRELLEALRVRRPRFVKWDARPGNALVREDGCVAWFDWEHCAARNRLDDMAWLLGDEYVPDYPATESKLVERWLPKFADDLSVDAAGEYLYAYGTFHMCVRLGLMLDNKKKGPWWDIDYCLKGDKVGITLASAQRTCRRAARWSSRTPLTDALSPWFIAVCERLETL